MRVLQNIGGKKIIMYTRNVIEKEIKEGRKERQKTTVTDSIKKEACMGNEKGSMKWNSDLALKAAASQKTTNKWITIFISI